MFEKVIAHLFYALVTVGNAIVFYSATTPEAMIIRYIIFFIYGIIILTGLISYRKEMAEIMYKKKTYREFVEKNIMSIYAKPIFNIIAAFIILLSGYSIFAFFIILSGFGEYTLYKRVENLIKSN